MFDDDSEFISEFEYLDLPFEDYVDDDILLSNFLYNLSESELIDCDRTRGQYEYEESKNILK